MSARFVNRNVLLYHLYGCYDTARCRKNVLEERKVEGVSKKDEQLLVDTKIISLINREYVGRIARAYDHGEVQKFMNSTWTIDTARKYSDLTTRVEDLLTRAIHEAEENLKVLKVFKAEGPDFVTTFADEVTDELKKSNRKLKKKLAELIAKRDKELASI